MITWEPEVLASGLGFPEGPVVLGLDDVAFVEIEAQRVSRWRGGARETIAATGGGPNGATLGPDGALYVANNGGLSVGPHGYWHAPEPLDGCVQRVGLDGTVSVLATPPASAPVRPNDLVFGPDGALYVTDPHNWEDLANLRPGRLWRVGSDGSTTLLAEPELFCNGIAFAADDALLVARSIGQVIDRYPWSPDGLGDPETLCRFPEGFPDGFCVTEDGHIIACGSMGHTIAVFAPDGERVQTIATGDGTEPTNCALGDGVLYVTLSGTGELVRVPAEARPLARA